ncbi:programmed cell death protein 6-like [Dermacentor variabilis]|uniref:programmed cell death protein 6-like n=1 Tax=Dermacentor variabilis TaxID=34621 RepID=UPI003F5C0A0B
MSTVVGSDYEQFLMKLFVDVDDLGAGVINPPQMYRALAYTISPFRHRSITELTAAFLITLVDRNNTGFVNMQQFLRIHQIFSHFWMAFRIYDPNDSGWIKYTDLEAAMAYCCLPMTERPANDVRHHVHRRARLCLDHFIRLCALSMSDMLDQ